MTSIGTPALDLTTERTHTNLSTAELVERALANLRRPGVRSQFTARLSAELANGGQMGPNPIRTCILQRALTTIIGLKLAADPLRRTRASQSPALFTEVSPRAEASSESARPRKRKQASAQVSDGLRSRAERKTAIRTR